MNKVNDGELRHEMKKSKSKPPKKERNALKQRRKLKRNNS